MKLQISELPLSIGMVQKEEAIIRKSQDASYWSNTSEEDYEELVDRLGPLMHFRESDTGSGPTHLDLKDETVNKEFVEFGPQHEAVSVSRYREMVEKLVLELTLRNPILQKIQQGATVSEAEADGLAQLLHEEHPHITEDLLRAVYKNRKAHFLQFIRHILGIEVLKAFPDTVSEAFAQFVRTHNNLNTQQLDFLQLLQQVIVERERIEKKDLIEVPFTTIHPQGIRGIFSPSEIIEILRITEQLAA